MPSTELLGFLLLLVPVIVLAKHGPQFAVVSSEVLLSAVSLHLLNERHLTGLLGFGVPQADCNLQGRDGGL